MLSNHYLLTILANFFQIIFASLDNLYIDNDIHNDIPCGRRYLKNLEWRIIGGTEALEGEVPWQALLKEKRLWGLIKHQKCGGVLISDQWVITAAHCQSGWFSNLEIILGLHSIKSTNNKTNNKFVTVKVKQIYPHPNYNKHRFENDIALIYLESPVTYSEYIQPICLSEEMIHLEQQIGFVSGWGYTDHIKAILPDKLQIVKVVLWSNEECSQMFSKAGYIRDFPASNICAGYPQGGRDSCIGDSGGPLMIQHFDGTWILVGIVSSGIECGKPNLPGVYTRIDHYHDWIIETIGTAMEK